MEYKSKEEEYFSYYLEELKSHGFIKSWSYETNTYELCQPYSRRYSKQLKTKVVWKNEHLLHKSSITADFTINWDKKSENIFYLNPDKPIDFNVKDIPFRTAGTYNWPEIYQSLIEVKPTNESTITSSISFPLKQKQLQKDHGLYVMKIKPFDKKKSCLFSQTFTPKKVIELEVYKRNSKFGKKGESMLKYEVGTLEEHLKLRGYA